MSIASEITRIKTNIANAYTALSSKGATLPTSQNSANLASTINSIESGGSSEYNAKLATGTSVASANYIIQKLIEEVDLSTINTSKFKSMQYMFNYCNSLTSLDLSNFDTSNVTNMYDMFSDCKSLTSLDVSNFDTSNVTNMSAMFFNCTSLTNLDLSNFNMCKVTNESNMFNACTNLTNLTSFYNLGAGYSTTQSANYSNYTLGLSSCTKLTHDSLMSIINNLYDIASMGCNAQQLVLGSTNTAKLTSAEIAIATNKGWIVS